MFKYRKPENKKELELMLKPITVIVQPKGTAKNIALEKAKSRLNSIYGKNAILVDKPTNINLPRGAKNKLEVRNFKNILQTQNEIIREQQETIAIQRKEMVQLNAHLKEICNVTLTKRANTIFIDID